MKGKREGKIQDERKRGGGGMWREEKDEGDREGENRGIEDSRKKMKEKGSMLNS